MELRVNIYDHLVRQIDRGIDIRNDKQRKEDEEWIKSTVQRIKENAKRS